MNLIVLLLVVIAALTVAVRVLDSRSTAGVLMLGVVALVILGPATSWLAYHACGSGLTVTATASDEASPVSAEAENATAAAEADGERGEQVAEPSATDATADDVAADTLAIDVEPESAGVVIPPRPSWVESEDARTGETHTTAVSSGPHETERECHASLDRELQRAVAEYIDWYLGNGEHERFKASTFIHYDLGEIKRRLVPSDKTYHEVIRVSFGPMHQMHAQLQFDAAFRRELDGRRDELKRHLREWIVSGRLLGTTLSFAVVLALMGVFFGYFRADTATRGFYTGRLQFVAAAVILTVLVAGTLLARILLM